MSMPSLMSQPSSKILAAVKTQNANYTLKVDLYGRKIECKVKVAAGKVDFYIYSTCLGIATETTGIKYLLNLENKLMYLPYSLLQQAFSMLSIGFSKCLFSKVP